MVGQAKCLWKAFVNLSEMWTFPEVAVEWMIWMLLFREDPLDTFFLKTIKLFDVCFTKRPPYWGTVFKLASDKCEVQSTSPFNVLDKVTSTSEESKLLICFWQKCINLTIEIKGWINKYTEILFYISIFKWIPTNGIMKACEWKSKYSHWGSGGEGGFPVT